MSASRAISTPSFLVINVSRIGDTLYATPAIAAIAAAYPGCHITACGHPKRIEVMQNLPFVQSVRAITKRRAGLRGWFGRQRYDYALVYGFDAPLVRYALRVAERVVAFEQDDAPLNRRLFKCVARPAAGTEHGVMRHLRLTQALDIPPAGLRLRFQVTSQEANAARARLTADVPVGASPLVGLHVSTFPTKLFRRWPIENFALLAERIAQDRRQAHFLIYGGDEEQGQTQWLKRRLGNRATLYAGRLTLRETAALMSLTDLYVGLDTGPTHIMSAFDIPLVVLYHCLSPGRLAGPLEHPCAYLLDHRPTAPAPCTEQSRLSELSVDAVYAKVARALIEHPPRQRMANTA